MEDAQSLYETYQVFSDELVRLNQWDRDLRERRSDLLSQVSEIDSQLSDVASRRQAAASGILDQTNIDLDIIAQAKQSTTPSHTAPINGIDSMDYDEEMRTLDDNGPHESLTMETTDSAVPDVRTLSEHVTPSESGETTRNDTAEVGAQFEIYTSFSKDHTTVHQHHAPSTTSERSSSRLSDTVQAVDTLRPSLELNQRSTTPERRSLRQSGLPVLDNESGIPHPRINRAHHQRNTKFQSLQGFPSVVHSDWQDCYDLHCPGCHGNLTAQGNFVKGVAGMKAHIRQEHGGQYQTNGMSAAEVVELCCRRTIAADDKRKLKLKDDVLAQLGEAGMDEWVVQEAPLRRGPWKDGARLKDDEEEME